MQDLENLCDILFKDEKQSTENLIAGFLDHNTKFKAALGLPTSGPLSVLIADARAATAGLATEVEAVQKTLQKALGEQLAGSDTTAADRQKAEDELGSIDSLITGLVKDPDAREGLRKFLFPEGPEQFTRAKVGDFPTLLRGFVERLKTKKDAFGKLAADVVASAETTFAPYIGTPDEGGAREQQVGRQKATADARDARLALRPRLQGQLTWNYHLLSLCHADKPATVLNYYTQRYFERQRVSNPAGERRRTVQANQAQVLVDLETYVDPARYQAVQVRLKDGGPARFFRTDEPSLPEPADALLIPAGDALHKFALADVPGTGSKLVLRNESGRVLQVELALLEG